MAGRVSDASLALGVGPARAVIRVCSPRRFECARRRGRARAAWLGLCARRVGSVASVGQSHYGSWFPHHRRDRRLAKGRSAGRPQLDRPRGVACGADESHEVRVKTADLERFVAAVTRWQLEDEAETGQLRVSAHEVASGRERFARSLAETVRAAASLDQSGLSAALRAPGAAAQEFADELDAADAPTRPTTS